MPQNTVQCGDHRRWTRPPHLIRISTTGLAVNRRVHRSRTHRTDYLSSTACWNKLLNTPMPASLYTPGSKHTLNSSHISVSPLPPLSYSKNHPLKFLLLSPSRALVSRGFTTSFILLLFPFLLVIPRLNDVSKC